MIGPDTKAEEVSKNGGRIENEEVRGLYDIFCAELIALSPEIDVEAALFETRITGPGEMRISIKPYADLFLVAVGASSPCSIRVKDRAGYFKALDISITHFLEKTLIANPGAVCDR